MTALPPQSSVASPCCDVATRAHGSLLAQASDPGVGTGNVLGNALGNVRGEFLREVIDTLLLRSGFNTNLVIIGTALLGLAAGVVGVLALLRKRSLTTDALSHATLPGITSAFLAAGWLGLDGRSLPILLLGATITGVLGVIGIQLLLRHTRLREDAAIGIVLSVFFGAGIVGLSWIQRNAATGSSGINAFIYGQAATMSRSDVLLLGVIALLAVAVTLLLLKEFALVCFDESFAKVDGWPVTAIDLAMMSLVVVVTVAGLKAVGVILVVAMLIIPAVAARFWTERLVPLVLLAAAIGAASGYFGSVLSALLPRKPAGAIIVLTAGSLFVVGMLAAPTRGVIAVAWRRFRLRLRIAGDHLLEAAQERRETTLGADALDHVARVGGWSTAFRALVLWTLRRQGMIERVRRALGGHSSELGAEPAASGRGLAHFRITSAGVARGARLVRNHALWEQYLISYADVAPTHVDWSVDQVEHVLSDALVSELEAALRTREARR